MKQIRVFPAAVCGAFILVLAGCGKTDADKTKVAAAPAAPASAAVAAGGTAKALPKLGAAPAWKLKDLNGAEVSSEQLKGKVVVVDFWATWCPPCREEIPGYIAMAEKYAKDGLVIVGISLDQAGADVVKAFAAKHKMNYPVVMGDDAVVSAFGGIEALPTTFLIDRDGQVRDRKEGYLAKEEYEQRILRVLKG